MNIYTQEVKALLVFSQRETTAALLQCTYLVRVHCVLVMGESGGLAPQTVHGTHPCTTEETGHADETTEHCGLNRNLSVPFTHSQSVCVWRRWQNTYTGILQMYYWRSQGNSRRWVIPYRCLITCLIFGSLWDFVLVPYCQKIKIMKLWMEFCFIKI